MRQQSKKLGAGLEMEAIGSAALSELVDGLREVEGKRITKREFEATLRQYLNGSHASQQIDQLWNKARLTSRIHESYRYLVFIIDV